MPAVHEETTVTSKGQVTLPKPIRQALGVGFGDKIAFDLIGDRIVVTRVGNEPHRDPAIASFLGLLERDIESGRHLTSLPEDLARSMLAALDKPVDLGKDIVGDVDL
jgi:antitoxin PrlF